jgi:hypothetical protein
LISNYLYQSQIIQNTSQNTTNSIWVLVKGLSLNMVIKKYTS